MGSKSVISTIQIYDDAGNRRLGRFRRDHFHDMLALRAIGEHLRGLEQLPATGFRFFAVPPPFRGVGTFPVRAFAVVG